MCPKHSKNTAVTIPVTTAAAMLSSPTKYKSKAKNAVIQIEIRE